MTQAGHDPRHRGVHESRAGARQDRRQAQRTSGRSGACSTKCSRAKRPSTARRHRHVAAVLTNEPDWTRAAGEHAGGCSSLAASLPPERSRTATSTCRRCAHRNRGGDRRTVASFAKCRRLAPNGAIRTSHSLGHCCGTCARASRHTDRVSARGVVKPTGRESGTEHAGRRGGRHGEYPQPVDIP